MWAGKESDSTILLSELERPDYYCDFLKRFKSQYKKDVLFLADRGYRSVILQYSF